MIPSKNQYGSIGRILYRSKTTQKNCPIRSRSSLFPRPPAVGLEEFLDVDHALPAFRGMPGPDPIRTRLQLFCILAATRLFQKHCHVGQSIRHDQAVPPQSPFLNGEGRTEHRFRFGISSLTAVDPGQHLQTRGGSRVARAGGLFKDLKRILQHRLGSGWVPLLVVHCRDCSGLRLFPNEAAQIPSASG